MTKLSTLDMVEQSSSPKSKIGQAAAYSGLFLRHYIGETPSIQSSSGAGIAQSPDILATGKNLVPDPNVFTTQDNYLLPYLQNNHLVQGAVNSVYCRGVNTAAVAQDARIWLFYMPSNVVLLPQDLLKSGVLTSNPANYIDLKNIPAGAIAVTNPPFHLSEDVVQPNAHYCLVAIAETPPFSNPPKPPIPDSVDSWQDFITFINNHPNFTSLNAMLIPNPGKTAYLIDPVSNTPDGGTFSIGVQLKNMPENDGSAVSFIVNGPDNANTIIFPKTQITDGNARYTQAVTWDADFPGSSISINYYPGSKTPPRGASITSSVWQQESAVRTVLTKAGIPSVQLEQKIESLPKVATYDVSDATRVTYPKFLVLGAITHLFPGA